jgi:glycosyltransferase involved in cell wall biosynthesis
MGRGAAVSTIPAPPVVSVIVPTHAGRATRLQSALASIWAQDGLDEQFVVEPIVVDDASTGPTVEVVQNFPGTRYVRRETSRGAAAARNAGLKEATGEYVAFLDDDDLWLPHRLSRQVALLEQARGVEVAYSQRAAYKRNGTENAVFPESEGPSGWVFETAIKTFICHINTVLIPREAVDKVGSFDESLNVVLEDQDFLARLALFFPFRYVHGVVAICLPSMTGWNPQQWRTALLKRRDNILALIEGEANEAEIKRLVLGTARCHVVYKFFGAGEFVEARLEFLQWLAEFPAADRGAWHWSQMKELTIRLALASDSPVDEARFLCTEVRRTGGRGSLRRRLEMRAFLADVWTAVAVHLASGRRRNNRMAASAAVRAILQNPLKPLSRPGLLRLVGRAIAPA